MSSRQLVMLILMSVGIGIYGAPHNNRNEAVDVDSDVESLKSFIKFCSSRSEFCKKDGLMEKEFKDELRVRDLSRAQIYVMKSLLRECLNDKDTCGLRNTVIIMDSLLDDPKSHKNRGLRRNSLKSVSGNSRLSQHRLMLPNVNSMFSRHGRRFGEWKKYFVHDSSLSAKSRAKRSNNNGLGNIFRKISGICPEPGCDNTVTASPQGIGNA